MTIDPLNSIKAFATLHHVIRKGQMYGVVPYTHHLSDVENVLREFGITDVEMLQASWGHDIIEDTDVKLRDIRENFGERVASLVFAVTSEEGVNRKTRNALTYPKIREAGDDAVRLKLADRIANVRNGGGSAQMYAKEHNEFRHQLYNPGCTTITSHMWACLDHLIEMAWAVSK